MSEWRKLPAEQRQYVLGKLESAESSAELTGYVWPESYRAAIALLRKAARKPARRARGK